MRQLREPNHCRYCYAARRGRTPGVTLIRFDCGSICNAKGQQAEHLRSDECRALANGWVWSEEAEAAVDV